MKKQITKIILLTILCILIIISNIIIAIALKYVDLILLCKLNLVEESINYNYGLIIYYLTVLPLVLFLIYKHRKNKYVLLVLIVKLYCMLSMSWLDNPGLHLFKELPACLYNVLKHVV